MPSLSSTTILLGLALGIQCPSRLQAFQPNMHRRLKEFHYPAPDMRASNSWRKMFFADEASEERLRVVIEPSEGDERSMEKAASFLIDAFWLDKRHLLDGDDDDNNNQLSAEARKKLCKQQTEDLIEKYGEKMGRPILDYALLTAKDESGEMQGMVCISGLLFDTQTEELLAYDESEKLLKTAVASLSPKERREYKNSGAAEIAEDLLGGEMQAVCCLTNLVVSPAARRSGIAMNLCDEAERMASVEWGFESLLLRVEDGNAAARRLYEDKLGYKLKCMEPAATALRVDSKGGEFVQIEADTLILEKEI